jgi:hypothetical protein
MPKRLAAAALAMVLVEGTQAALSAHRKGRQWVILSREDNQCHLAADLMRWHTPWALHKALRADGVIDGITIERAPDRTIVAVEMKIPRGYVTWFPDMSYCTAYQLLSMRSGQRLWSPDDIK